MTDRRVRAERARWLAAVPDWAWLTAIVAGSLAVLLLEVRSVPFPTVFADELIYSGAGKRLALGHGPAVDGGAYGYGLVYPLLLAPLYRLSPHTNDAYAAIKVLNAVAFSVAAVPAFLLARRVARIELALGVALLTVLLPARPYVPLVLTESVAFLVFLCVVLAAVRVLERPSFQRQLLALGLCVVAVETRRQFLLLVAAIPVMLVIGTALEGGGLSETGRRLARRYAVTWAVFGLAITAALAETVGRDRDFSALLLGPYSVLADSYEFSEIARWGMYHTAAYGLMFAVVPLIALPFGLASCLGPDAPPRHRSVGLATVVLVPAFLIQVAVVSSSPFAQGRVHERYLFYVAPLVLAMFVRWIDDGLPRSRSLASATIATTIVATPLLLPRSGVGVFETEAPVLYWLGYGGTGPFWLVAVVVGSLLALTLFIVRPTHGAILIGVVAVAFATVDFGVHEKIATGASHTESLATGGYHGNSHGDWVDTAIGRDTAVDVLYVGPPMRCFPRPPNEVPGSPRYWRLAFFNHGIDRVIGIDTGLDLGVPVMGAAVRKDGTVALRRKAPATHYIVTDARIEVAGRLIRYDPASRLSLWKPSLPLRVENIPPGASIAELLCPAGR